MKAKECTHSPFDNSLRRMETTTTLFKFCIFSLSLDLCEASFPQRNRITMGINIESPAKVAHALDESHISLRTAFAGGKSILPTSAKYLVPS